MSADWNDISEGVWVDGVKQCVSTPNDLRDKLRRGVQRLNRAIERRRAEKNAWKPALIVLVAFFLALVAGSVRGADDLDAWLKRQAQPAYVYVFTARSCSVCPRQQVVLDWLNRSGWVNAKYGSGTLAHYVVVDTDANPEIAKRYGIGAVPAIVAMRGETVIARHEGLLGPDDVRGMWYRARGM